MQLRLALRLHSDPAGACQRLLAGLSGGSWKEAGGWRMYLAFQGVFDAFIGEGGGLMRDVVLVNLEEKAHCRHLLKNILNTANAPAGGEFVGQLRTTLLANLPLVAKITSGLISDDTSMKGGIERRARTWLAARL